MLAAGEHLHRIHAADAGMAIRLDLDACRFRHFTQRLPLAARDVTVEILERHRGLIIGRRRGCGRGWWRRGRGRCRCGRCLRRC